MPSLTTSNFSVSGESLAIAKHTRVFPANQLPFPPYQRSFAPNYVPFHFGLGACWGFTPGGSVVLGCSEKERETNDTSREFLIDAVAFTSPCEGTLRLYATPLLVPIDAKVPLVAYNDSTQVAESYQLSQVFEDNQFQFVFPGATEFWAPENTTWIIIEAPLAYTWTATVRPRPLSPTTIAILSTTRGLVPTKWTIKF